MLQQGLDRYGALPYGIMDIYTDSGPGLASPQIDLLCRRLNAVNGVPARYPVTDAKTPHLPEIAAYKFMFDGTRWTRDDFLADGTLADSVRWQRGEAPVLPGTPAPFRADITLSNGQSRGRNGWFRAALTQLRTWTGITNVGLPEVTIDVYGRRRDARRPPISIGLSRRDAEALGWALVAVATTPPAPPR